LRKALSITARDQQIVLGADTIVVCDGRVFGKPADAAEARRILRGLSGRRHSVYTGLALVRGGAGVGRILCQNEAGSQSAPDVSLPDHLWRRRDHYARVGRLAVGYVRTVFWLRRLSKSDIDSYVSSGEPMDKAGAYAVQGRGAVLVRAVRGCYTNVIGLPVPRLLEMLAGLECRSPQPDRPNRTLTLG
jgi:septum formation protein